MLRSLSNIVLASARTGPSPIIARAMATAAVPRIINSGAAAAGEEKRIKHKTPRRRATALHEILKNEEKEKLLNGRVYPELIPGDSIRIEKLPYASAPSPDVITGVIIAKYNKSYDTRIDVLNVVDGVGVKWMVRIFDPLVKNISVIDKRYAYRFKKTTRSRSKLYYLFDKDPTLYQVKSD